MLLHTADYVQDTSLQFPYCTPLLWLPAQPNSLGVTLSPMGRLGKDSGKLLPDCGRQALSVPYFFLFMILCNYCKCSDLFLHKKKTCVPPVVPCSLQCGITLPMYLYSAMLLTSNGYSATQTLTRKKNPYMKYHVILCLEIARCFSFDMDLTCTEAQSCNH